jgi:hypothetical protein
LLRFARNDEFHSTRPEQPDGRIAFEQIKAEARSLASFGRKAAVAVE